MTDHLVSLLGSVGRLVASGPLFGAWYGPLLEFSGFSAMMWTSIVLMLAAVWWFSAIFLRDGKTVKTYDSPPRLLRELCQAHKLSGREIDVLRQLADERGLESPLPLFVREDYFAEHTAAEYAALRKKLFATTDTGAENAGVPATTVV
jgi:hypothetical protein